MVVIAVLCALAVAYWGVVRGALNRMTLSDASEAASKRLGGVNLVSIVEHRQAALIAVNIVQLLHGMVAAVAVTLAIGTVVHHPWLLALSAR